MPSDTTPCPLARAQAFFRDFAAAFAKLVAKGCPRECQPNLGMPAEGERKAIAAAAEVRELSMHGSLEQMQRVIKENGGPGSVDIDSSDIDSGRTALHKAAFWGHAHVVKFLTRECLCKVGATDFAGDTALHDAARFGHTEIVRILLDVGADVGTTNKAGQTPIALARMHGKVRRAPRLVMTRDQLVPFATRPRPLIACHITCPPSRSSLPLDRMISST